jgi:MFS family permease
MATTVAHPDARRTPRVDANAVRAVVAVAQFIMILDASIVNVSLPTIKRDVGFSEPSLSWILNAYTFYVRRFPAARGRLGDLLGRGRLSMAGIALFSGASLLCGVARSEGELLLARGFQRMTGPGQRGDPCIARAARSPEPLSKRECGGAG